VATFFNVAGSRRHVALMHVNCQRRGSFTSSACPSAKTMFTPPRKGVLGGAVPRETDADAAWRGIK